MRDNLITILEDTIEGTEPIIFPTKDEIMGKLQNDTSTAAEEPEANEEQKDSITFSQN